MSSKIRITVISVFAMTMIATVAFAQMGGMMGGQGNDQMSGMMGGAMGGMMGAGMGNGMANDFAAGPDGTVYVVRAVQAQAPMTPGNPTQRYTFKHELAALSPSDGALRWKLELTGGRVSEPVLGKDGRIFLTLDDGQMASQGRQGGGMMGPGGPAGAGKSRFLVISVSGNSATVATTVELDSDFLSTPKVVSTGLNPADYVVYVTGVDLPEMTDNRGSMSAGQKILYAFLPEGKLKFKVKISQ